MRKIRVLRITNSLNYGGLERVVIDICNNMDRKEFDPMVACISCKDHRIFTLKAWGAKCLT